MRLGHTKVATALSRHPSTPRSHVCDPGMLSALLPNGIYINACETHQRILLFELHCLRVLRPPPRDEVERFECEYLAPLHRCMMAAQPKLKDNAVTDPWWSCPQAIEIVARSLGANSFAIVDNFLPPGDLQKLLDASVRLYENGDMHSGKDEGNAMYWGEANAGDFVNEKNEEKKWDAWGNRKVFVRDRDKRAPDIALLARATDELVSRLKGMLGTDPSVVNAEVRHRLAKTDFREHSMVATYRGRSRGRYLRHTDIGRNAVLTALYYLNEGWKKEDRGELRTSGHPRGHGMPRTMTRSLAKPRTPVESKE